MEKTMKDAKRFAVFMFGISIVGYLLAVVYFHGAYEEAVGETIFGGKLVTVHRSWRECLLCIGSSLLFALLVNVIAFITNAESTVEIDELEIDEYVESSTALQRFGSYARVAVVEPLRMFAGVMVLLVEGVMFGAMLLEKCCYSGGGEVMLLLSCLAMVLYAVTEGVVAARKELSFLHW